jgi:serine protease Do
MEMKRANRFKRAAAVVALASAIFSAGFIGGKSLDIERAASLVATPALAGQEIESLPDVIERVSCSVVYIESTTLVEFTHPMMDDPFWRRFFNAPREREQNNLGSGVIISADGYILTNNHLVGGATEVKVHCVDGREFDAEVVGADEDSDVAVIKIEGDNLPMIDLGSSADLRLGETVIAIGYPFGIGQTVTKGIVSAQGKSLGLVDYEDFIQTDAAINPGNSGGALINERGELIGINTAIASRTGGSHGIGFAIPIDFARSIMNSLIEDGRVIRGYVGVSPQPVTNDMIEYFGLESKDGVLIAQVEPGTPADRAGLEQGDVIVEFDSKNVKEVDQFRIMAAEAEPGEKVKMVVVRDGKRKNIEIEIGERPSDTASQGVEDDAEDISPLFLGVGLQTLKDEYREQLSIPGDVTGVIVTDVQRRTPAAEAGLRRGDVIVEVDKKNVDNLGDFRAIMDDYDDDKIMVVIFRGGGYFYTMIKK